MVEWLRVREIFEELVDLAPDQRPARLDARCAGDGELRAEFEALLAKDQEMEDGTAPALPERPNLQPAAFGRARPRQIGNYQIVRVLGSGGMGTVFEARQERPERTVALKILRAFVTSDSARRRLDYEAETLGRLRHPNIAQIHESGTWQDPDTGEASPFFAMEFVENARTLVDYAVAEQLGLRARLGLFLGVCDAVHHGHQQGVLHRDLKPANVLVGDDGHPKVIDFGLARATDAADDDRALRTLTGQALGTPGYMSPEQLDGDAASIDVRTDVYGLGATLYELLVGRPPHEKGTDSLARFLARVREDRPARPSTVRGAADGGAAALAVPEDLDWVLLRALAARPDERYASVFELGADLRRFLADEPLVARPPTRGYLLRKFVRRNRLAVAAFAAVMVALLAGAVAAAIGWRHALESERLADSRREQAEALANDLLYLSEQQTEILGGARGDRNARMVDVLERASARVAAAPPDSDQIAAGLHDALGVAFFHLGLTDRAEFHLQRALERVGKDGPAMRRIGLAVQSSMAMLLQQRGKLEEAETMRRDVLRGRVEEYGSDHWRTAAAKLGLAGVLVERGDHLDAAALYRQALPVLQAEFGRDHERMIPALTGLAMASHALGDTERAGPLYEEACALAQLRFGRDDPETLSTQNTLAVFLMETQRVEEAIPMLRDLWDRHARISGPDHRSTLRAASNLAVCAERQQHFVEAEAIYREILQARRDAGGGNEVADLITRFNLCVSLHQQPEPAKLAEAITELDALVDDASTMLPGDNWRLAVFRQHRGIALRKAARYADAEAEFDAARTILEQRLGPTHSRTRSNWEETAILYEAWGRADDAARWRAKLAGH